MNRMRLPPLAPSLILGAAILALACSNRSSAPATAPTEPAGETPEQEQPPEDTMTHEGFSQGPALTPHNLLFEWLNTQAGSKTLRLPVVIKASPLGITSAHLAENASPHSQKHPLKLDQGALGVPLHERLPKICDEGPCAVWLEGTWGSNVSGGPSLPGPGGPSMPGPSGPTLPGPDTPSPESEGAPVTQIPKPFTVRKLIGPVEGSATHIYVKD
ncbi:MAG: hypothetical protein EA397_19030 [Deltaproteobacteria bacterium]|nr:MAG: hypothetical protein EA397_19030 [Deltaproteobacteria bacterium]